MDAGHIYASVPGGVIHWYLKVREGTIYVWEYPNEMLITFYSCRTQQYIHNPTDVIAGSILGLIVGVITHFSRIPLPSYVEEEEDEDIYDE
jgi:hypothetical protein